MKKTSKKNIFFRRLLKRYRQMPRQLRSRRVSERSSAQKLLTVTICVPVMLFCMGWMAAYYIEKAEIERSNAAYQALYQASTPAATTAMPSETPEVVQTTASPEPLTAAPTKAPATAVPATEAPTTPAATIEAVPTEALPSSTPVSENPLSSTMLPQLPLTPDRTYAPHGTKEPDTVIISMQSPPPVQESFRELIAMNPETVGYLTIPGQISLPVVQRKNDNDFYLNHAFDLSESEAGTLFLDGTNLLTPEDQNLLVYGHNMKNGTMFHRLINYAKPDYLMDNALVYFDTIYENRVYVPFAVFQASMEPENDFYIDIRQFIFDETSFGFFVKNMQALSRFKIPVDVAYEDRLLLLVTCEYVHDNGRFVVALRELRDGETEEQMRELMRDVKEK